MERPGTYTARTGLLLKAREVAALFKLRLTSLVVVSAVLGYWMGVPKGGFVAADAVLLALAGMLVTGASNALNQLLEVEADGRMQRTAGRPLVKGTLNTTEALAVSILAGITGTLILWLAFGPLTGILGLMSLFMYVALYTPLKRSTAWAVFVGAFPGAFPPMLGFVAATGHFGLGPGLLFAMQFMWQFPHFWSIAWVLHDDYKLADYHLLPSRGGRDRYSAFLIVLYTLFMIPVGVLPTVFGFTGPWAMAIAITLGAWMLVHALRLLRTLEKKDARRLMFASFLYLPVVQLAYVLDKA
ncbi:MAG: heme o synthase [Flavobacteriales bacterium]